MMALALAAMAGCASSTPTAEQDLAPPPPSAGAPPASPGTRPAGPGPENPRLSEAKKLARGKDLEGAIKATRVVVEEEPGSEEAHLLLASLCAMKEDIPCANAALEKGLEALPDSWALLHARGMARLESNQVEPAVADLERAHSITEGASPEVMADLAYAYVFVNRLDEAELMAAAARRLDPKAFAAAYAHGEALIRKDKAKEALEAYEAALALEPSNTSAKRRQAMALSKLDQNDKALAIYGQLLGGEGARDPSLHAAKAGVLMKLGKPADAVKSMREATKLAPKDTKLLDLLAQAEEAAGDKKAAKATRAKLKALGGE